MNKFYLLFILIISNIKIIIPIYDEFSQLNFNSNSDEDNNNDHILKSNIKNLFLYGSHLSEFLISQSQTKGGSSKEADELYGVFRHELKNIINNTKNISFACKNHLYKKLIGYDESDHYIQNYHIKKLIDDSSKHRNYLGTYDQCINKRYKYNFSEEDEISAYVVLTLDRTYEKKGNSSVLMYKKNSTEFEQVFFIRGFCLPQENNDTCKEKEYKNFITAINEDLDDLLGINITNIYTFMIRKNENKYEDGEGFLYFLKFIPLIICLIQVFLVMFREIIINIIIYFLNKYFGYNIKNENEDLLDKFNPTNNNEENDEEDENDDNDNEKNTILNNKNNNVPKWIIIYNKCFNFSENFKELFNFKLNSTNINNDSGLTYIRGFKATSLFVLVAGLTFFTLMNSLSVIFSKTLFLEFLKEWFFYSIFFIGLRYAPGFIFSCSGYTLAYKFLSYCDKNFSFLSIIKFIFYQSHKYLILIGYSLFQRFTLYPLFSLANNTPMWKFLNEMILTRPESSIYFLSFLGWSYFKVGDKRYDQTIVDYFWIPFNEIAFFLCGILIISFGYKFKLRIDYFIIILIFIIYISKILYTYFKKTEENESYYPTLYYYLFDYGKFMTTPEFNFPSYLIGMYFGFINYCVQKGIISITVSDLLKNTTKSSTNKIKEEEMDLSINNNNNNNKSLDEEEEDDDDEEQDINKKKNQEVDENDKSNYRNEIIQMPFLISGVKISNWLRKHRARLLSLILALLCFFSLFIHFFQLKVTVSDEINKIKNTKKDTFDALDRDQCKAINNTLTLENYLANGLINFIFRIDIEIIVFFSQSLFFISYFKGKNFVNNFFCHIFWAMFNKSYFSYILVANPIILFIFYQSETKILLNLYNLILYSLISGTLIFLSASFSYIFFELPYKKIIKIICSNDSNDIDIEENENEKEEETKSEDEDD